MEIDFENDSDNEVGEKLWKLYIGQRDGDGYRVAAIFDRATKSQLECFDEIRRREHAKQKENKQ